jgi:hypothetical protein
VCLKSSKELPQSKHGTSRNAFVGRNEETLSEYLRRLEPAVITQLSDLAGPESQITRTGRKLVNWVARESRENWIPRQTASLNPYITAWSPPVNNRVAKLCGL